MKTLIINGSPRKNGNTATLLNELKKHLHGEIFQIDTYYTKISPCIDCRYCWTHAECAIKDEMLEIYRIIDEVDNIVLASPLYFSNLTGSLLNWASRLQYIWVSKNIRKEPALSSKVKNGAFILVNGEEGCKGEAAISTGGILLKHMGVPNYELLFWPHSDDINQPSPTNKNMGKIVKLADTLNTR